MRMTVRDANARYTAYRIVHAVLTALCFGAALGGLIYALIALNDMPDTVGYHFAPNGYFDLFGDKRIAFLHPVIAEWLLLAIFNLVAFGAYRTKPLKLFSPAGNRRIADLVAATCDLLCLVTAVIFGHWIYCVAEQAPLRVTFVAVPFALAIAAVALLVVGLLVAIICLRIRANRAKRTP